MQVVQQPSRAVAILAAPALKADRIVMQQTRRPSSTLRVKPNQSRSFGRRGVLRMTFMSDFWSLPSIIKPPRRKGDWPARAFGTGGAIRATGTLANRETGSPGG